MCQFQKIVVLTLFPYLNIMIIALCSGHDQDILLLVSNNIKKARLGQELRLRGKGQWQII